MFAFLCFCAAVVAGCSHGVGPEGHPWGDSPEPAGSITIRLTSAAFADGASIPQKYTCDGENLSPPLAWSNLPPKTRSLALICEDPDAPMGTFTHWVIFNMPPSLTELKEGIPTGEEVNFGSSSSSAELIPRQGKNDFGKIGYGGPCPPSGMHRYVFLLYALDFVPTLKPGVAKGDLTQTFIGHIQATGRLVGTYSR